MIAAAIARRINSDAVVLSASAISMIFLAVSGLVLMCQRLKFSPGSLICLLIRFFLIGYFSADLRRSHPAYLV
ncbi:MAG: hypothetical protein ACRCZS_07025, partial [Chroococcidiopsis sp.]